MPAGRRNRYLHYDDPPQQPPGGWCSERVHLIPHTCFSRTPYATVTSIHAAVITASTAKILNSTASSHAVSFDSSKRQCRTSSELISKRHRNRHHPVLLPWYSHKFNGPGVSFEVVSDPMEGKIRWINGPEPASIHDLTFLRGGKKGQTKKWKRSSLYFHLPKSARLIGDSAYEGQPDKVSTTKDAHKPATKKLFARMKSMQETCFKRFKDFRVLRESFRHGKSTEDKLAKIKSSFEAVVLDDSKITVGRDLLCLFLD
eukprot:scaffold28674_cov66-Skeletonema_marinoi.AAC.1